MDSLTCAMRDMKIFSDVFEKKKTSDFNEFAKSFKDLHMSLIYIEQDKKEINNFVGGCFKFILDYLEEKAYTFQKKMGAIFLLYCIYRSQPCIIKFKIRVTKSQYQEILNVWNAKKGPDGLDLTDVHFAIYDLHMENAFEYVVHNHLVGPLARYYQDPSKHSYPYVFTDKDTGKKTVDSSDPVERKLAEKIEELRSFAQEKLVGTPAIPGLLSPSMFQQLCSKRSIETQSDQASGEVAESNSKNESCGDSHGIGDRRLFLKEQQFKTIAVNHKVKASQDSDSDNKLQIINEDETEPGPLDNAVTDKPKRRRQRRRGRRAKNDPSPLLSDEATELPPRKRGKKKRLFFGGSDLE